MSAGGRQMHLGDTDHGGISITRACGSAAKAPVAVTRIKPEISAANTPHSLIWRSVGPTS